MSVLSPRFQLSGSEGTGPDAARVGLPLVRKRWRECDYGTDHGIHRIVEEVGLDVPLTATTGKDEVAESDSAARSV